MVFFEADVQEHVEIRIYIQKMHAPQEKQNFSLYGIHAVLHPRSQQFRSRIAYPAFLRATFLTVLALIALRGDFFASGFAAGTKADSSSAKASAV